MDQKTLANKAGLSQSGLSAIENGRRDLTVSTLRRIASSLGVSPSFLLTGEPVRSLSLSRHDYDAIARAVASGERCLSHPHNCLADEMAAIFTLKLEAHGLHGFKRISRLKPDNGSRLLKLKIKYGGEIIERLADRIDRHFSS